MCAETGLTGSRVLLYSERHNPIPHAGTPSGLKVGASMSPLFFLLLLNTSPRCSRTSAHVSYGARRPFRTTHIGVLLFGAKRKSKTITRSSCTTKKGANEDVPSQKTLISFSRD